MSIAKHARASQVVKNMKSGQYHTQGKWRGYGRSEEDRPSWDYRFRTCPAEVNAQRRVRTAKQ